MEAPSNNSNTTIKNSSSLKSLVSLPTLALLTIVIIFIWFVSTQFDLDWKNTWIKIKSIDKLLYISALIAYYSSFIFRGKRWRCLIQNANLESRAKSTLPSTLKFSQLILIGWFVNSIAWLRMGDAYRAYALTQETKINMTSSLGTIVAERVTDLICILILLVVGITWLSNSHQLTEAVNLISVAILLTILLVISLLIIKRFGNRLSQKLPTKIRTHYEIIHSVTFGSLQRMPTIMIYSLIAWLCESARLYLVLMALDLSITLPLILIVSLSHAILSIIPTPGGVGAVEPGVASLLLFELTQSDALSVALIDRTITYLSVLIFGSINLIMWKFILSRTDQQKEPGLFHYNKNK